MVPAPPAAADGPRSELGDVGAEGGERQTARPRPSRRSAPPGRRRRCRRPARWSRRGRSGRRRRSSPRGRPARRRRRRSPSSAGRARAGAAGGCGRARPRRDEVEVGAAQAEHEQRRGGDVGDGVGERHLGRDRLAGELGRDLLGRDHGDSLEAAPAGRSGPPAAPRPRSCRRRRSRRRSPRRRCRGGPRARSPAPASPPGESASSKRWSAAKSPATIAAALEPSPRASGISLRRRKAMPSAGVQALEGADDRLSRPVETSSPPGSSENSPVSSTSSSRCSETAAAITS